MYVTYYFVLGKVPWRSPCIQSLHFIHKELKPRAVTLLRVTKLYGGKAGTRSHPSLPPHHHYDHHHHLQYFSPQLALRDTCTMTYVQEFMIAWRMTQGCFPRNRLDSKVLNEGGPLNTCSQEKPGSAKKKWVQGSEKRQARYDPRHRFACPGPAGTSEVQKLHCRGLPAQDHRAGPSHLLISHCLQFVSGDIEF